jgi:hypothetical protein
LMIVTAGLLAAAPPAYADTQYGGTASLRNAPAGPAMTLVRRDSGRIDVRMTVAYQCKNRSFTNRIVRLTGTTPDGLNFTAAGKTRMQARGTVRFAMTGVLAADSVSGQWVMSLKGCPKFTRDLVLRTESAPAGAPALPPASSLFNGLTGQTVGGIRLAITLRVTTKGRVWSRWEAEQKCGPKGHQSMSNDTPTTTIKADGTFTRNETYTIRYRGGGTERFRVTLTGRFLADGAVGTLRARSQYREPGKRYYPCDSGTQTWAARL